MEATVGAGIGWATGGPGVEKVSLEALSFLCLSFFSHFLPFTPPWLQGPSVSPKALGDPILLTFPGREAQCPLACFSSLLFFFWAF